MAATKKNQKPNAEVASRKKMCLFGGIGGVVLIGGIIAAVILSGNDYVSHCKHLIRKIGPKNSSFTIRESWMEEKGSVLTVKVNFLESTNLGRRWDRNMTCNYRKDKDPYAFSALYDYQEVDAEKLKEVQKRK